MKADLKKEVRAGWERGWRFTPLRGKKPYLDDWQNRKPGDLGISLGWAGEGNVGLRTGMTSGIAVIDIDPGAIVGPPDFPLTVTAKTGRNGYHLYYRCTEPIRNRAGTLMNENNVKLAHVDVRGDGGQVVFVGSVHPDTGNQYRWTLEGSPDRCSLAPFPMQFLKRPEMNGNPAYHPPADSDEAERRCVNYLKKIPDSVAGESGHNACFLAACTAWRFGLERGQVHRVMAWFNQAKCHPMWTDLEIVHKIDSSFERVSGDGELGLLIRQSEEKRKPASPKKPATLAEVQF